MPIAKRCLLWDWTNTANIPHALDKMNYSGPISSLHNWNTWAPPELKNRLPFRPMVRTEGQLSGQDWVNVENNTQPIVHFFNEPERAGISAERAAEVWMKQLIPLRKEKGTKLVSPSCASDPSGEAWLADFMARVAENRPDYLGVHYYGTDAGAAIKYIESMHDKYPGQPIIVSEIASISRDKHDVREFTARLANWMDEKDWIFEYGFFGCMQKCADGFVSPQAQLMNETGEFTDLMYKLMWDQPIKI